MKREEVEQIIRERSDDPQFREALLADPRGTLSEIIGITLNDPVTVTVHEESLTDVHLVIPAVTSGDDLSEADLDIVGGGVWRSAGCSSDPCAV